LVRNTPELLGGVARLAQADGLADGRFATETDGGTLWYDGATGRIRLEADEP
jgi:hypothetical protein